MQSSLGNMFYFTLLLFKDDSGFEGIDHASTSQAHPIFHTAIIFYQSVILKYKFRKYH